MGGGGRIARAVSNVDKWMVVVQPAILQIIILYDVVMPLARAGPLANAQAAGATMHTTVGPHHVIIYVGIPARFGVEVATPMTIFMEVALLNDVMVGVVPVGGLEDEPMPPISGDVHRVQRPAVV